MPIRVYRTTPQPQQEPSLAQTGDLAPVPPSRSVDQAVVSGTGELARLSQSILREEQDRYLETRVREIDIQRRQADAGALNDYLSSTGSNAVNGRQQAMERIRANSKDTLASIQDPELRALWQIQDAQLTASALDQVDRHYRSERMRWESDTHQNRAAVLTQDFARTALGEGYDAATGTLSPEAQRNRSAYLAEIEARGKLLGADPAAVELEKRKADEDAFAPLVAAMIDEGRVEEAAMVVDRYKDALAPGTQGKIGRLLQSGQQDDRETKVAMAVERAVLEQYRQSRGALSKDRPLSAEERANYLPNATDLVNRAFEEGKIDAKTRDGVLDRVTKDFERQQKAYTAQGQAMLDQAKATLVNNPNLGWRQLPVEERMALEEHGLLDAVVAFSDSNNREATDPVFEAGLEGYTQAQLAAIDPADFRLKTAGYLSPARRDAWIAKIEKAKGGADGKQTRIASLEDYKQQAARTMGILPTGKTATAEQRQAFENWGLDFDKRVIAPWVEAHKRQPTDQEVRDLIDLEANNTLKRDYPTWFGLGTGTETVRFKDFLTEQSSEYYVEVRGMKIRASAISSVKKAQIAQILQQSGIQPTPEAIVEWYLKSWEADPTLPDIRPQEPTVPEPTAQIVPPPGPMTPEQRKAYDEQYRLMVRYGTVAPGGK